MTSFLLRLFWRPVIHAKKDRGRDEGAKKEDEGVLGVGSGRVGWGGGDLDDVVTSSFCNLNGSGGGRGGRGGKGGTKGVNASGRRRGDSGSIYGLLAKTGDSSSFKHSSMHDRESVTKGSEKSHCGRSTGVAKLEADDVFEESDDHNENACWILSGIANVDRRGLVMTWSRVSRTSMWTTSNTSEEPRGVSGGGAGSITNSDRPDIKLSGRSCFLVWLAGDVDHHQGPSA